MKTFYISSDYLPFKEPMISLWKRALRTVYLWGDIDYSSRKTQYGYEKIKYAQLLIKCDYNEGDLELYPEFHFVKKSIADAYYNQLVYGEDTGHDYNEGKILKQYKDYIIKELKENRYSRRAVISLGYPYDIVHVLQGKEISCPREVQFQIRNNKLHMHVTFRSKDIVDYADFYAFRKYQYEQIAKPLKINMGSSSFYITNAHIRIEDDLEIVKNWKKEGLI